MARRAMAAGVDRNGLQVLDRATCLDLLATAVFGRLAYVSGGTPRVIPLNLVLEDEAVLFRLSTGGALTAITSRQLVALEVDELDPERASRRRTPTSTCPCASGTSSCAR